jgi:hypothetical protein
MNITSETDNKKGRSSITGKEIFASTSMASEIPFDAKNSNESLNPTQPVSKWTAWFNWFNSNSPFVNSKGDSNSNPMYVTGH